MPCKSADWFLYSRDLHHERANLVKHDPYRLMKINKPWIPFMTVFSLYKFVTLGHYLNVKDIAKFRF